VSTLNLLWPLRSGDIEIPHIRISFFQFESLGLVRSRSDPRSSPVACNHPSIRSVPVKEGIRKASPFEPPQMTATRHDYLGDPRYHISAGMGSSEMLNRMSGICCFPQNHALMSLHSTYPRNLMGIYTLSPPTKTYMEIDIPQCRRMHLEYMRNRGSRDDSGEGIADFCQVP
jgi:hypothetical protein